MLGIIGLVFVIVAPFFIYRSARQNGHNAVFWTLLALALGLGLQLIIPLLVGIVLGVIWVGQGYSPEEIQQSMQTPATIFGVIALFLSIGGILMIMRRVNTVRESGESFSPPPAPPNFQQGG